MLLGVAVLLAFMAARAGAISCDSQPIALPIQDVQVLPNVAGSLMRGIPVKFGSPLQNLLVLPWAELNNTWLYNYQPYCDSSIIFSDMACRVKRGNFFYENASTTYHKALDITRAGGASRETGGRGAELGIKDLVSTSLGGSDTFSPGRANLAAFPIGIPRENWDHGYTILHAMGMGANSTFLNSLLQTGQIASRVWSIFWGRMWVSKSLDGSVVLGGYDQAMVIGQNYTQPLDYSGSTGCWTGMRLTVSDIQVAFRNGNTTTIFPPNFALPVCIVPQRQLLIEAPSQILDIFENVTNTKHVDTSFGLHWSAAIYNANNVFDGDLTIHFSSGLEIRVPNDQYIVPFVDINGNGSRYFNTSRREFLFNGLSDQPATLGRYFLTSAYLMVNHDDGTFTLWKANPTNSSALVSIASNTAAQSCASGTIEADATSSSSSLSAGAIAGIVVGCAAALAAIIYATYSLLGRKEKANISPEPIPARAANTNDDKYLDVWQRHEMPSDNRPPELHESTGFIPELDGQAPISVPSMSEANYPRHGGWR